MKNLNHNFVAIAEAVALLQDGNPLSVKTIERARKALMMASALLGETCAQIEYLKKEIEGLKSDQ